MPGAVSGTTDGRHSFRGIGGIPLTRGRYRNHPKEALLQLRGSFAEGVGRRLNIEH